MLSAKQGENRGKEEVGTPTQEDTMTEGQGIGGCIQPGEELSNLPELRNPPQYPNSSMGVSGSGLCGEGGQSK